MKKAIVVLALSFLTSWCALPGMAADPSTIMEVIRTQHGHPVKVLDAEVPSLSTEQRRSLVSQLTQSLKSPNWEEQANAAYVAGLLGPEALPLVPDLIACMDAKMENVAWDAVPALGKIGGGAVPYVVASLKSQDVESRPARHLLQALGAIGPAAVSAVPVMVPFLINGKNTGAVKALRSIGPAGFNPLCRALENCSDFRIYVYAGYVFADFNEPASAAIAPMLKSKRMQTVQGFTYILSKIANEKFASCLPGLVSALRSDNQQIGNQAQTALIRIGPAAAQAVHALVADDDIAVQRRAAAILQQLGPGATTASATLQSGLSAKNPESACMAAATLLKINGSPAALAKLLELLKSSDEKTRVHAANALGTAGPHSAGAVAALAAALKDPTPHVRAAAATALGQIGPAAQPALNALIEAATSHHPSIATGHELLGMDLAIQQQAIVAIGKIGPGAAAAVPTLVRLITDKTGSFSIDCILQALANMKAAASPAVPALVIELSDRTVQQRAVIETLVAIGHNAAPAIPALEKIVSGPRGASRKQAFEAILSIESDLNRRRLFVNKYLNDADFELKSAALAALGQIPGGAGTADNLPTLLAELQSHRWNDRLSSIKALGNLGPTASAALPILVKENIRSMRIGGQRELAFEAIKKIDPSGQRVIPLVKTSLESPFEVRAAVELLEFIGSPQTKEVASATRARWKLK